jgi:hypothetical protein
VRAPVIHRPQLPRPQPVHQLRGVVPVALVAALRFAAPIAHHHPCDPPDEEVVEPLRLRALLERHVDGATHPAEELEDRGRLGRHNAPRDHAAGVVADDGDRRCLVDIESDILGRLLHESRSLL